MRVLCLSAILLAATAPFGAAIAQTAPVSQAPAPAPAKLSSVEVRMLRTRLEALNLEVRKELMVYFRANPGSGSRSPTSLTDAAMESGLAFTAKPVSEKHRLLIAERAEIAAKILGSGELVEQTRMRAGTRAPTTSTQPGPRILPIPQQPKEWR